MKCKKCEEYYIYNDYKFCSICYKQMNGYDYVSIDNIKDCLIKKYINKNKFNLLLKILLGNISKKITLLEVSNLVDDTFLMSNECNIIYGLLKDKITNYSPLGVSEEQQGLQHYWYGSAYNLEHILFSEGGETHRTNDFLFLCFSPGRFAFCLFLTLFFVPGILD